VISIGGTRTAKKKEEKEKGEKKFVRGAAKGNQEDNREQCSFGMAAAKVKGKNRLSGIAGRTSLNQLNPGDATNGHKES